MGKPTRNYYPFAGELLSVNEICERTGLEWSTVTTRIHCGKLPLEAPLHGYPARYRIEPLQMTRTAKEWAAYWDISTKNARQRIDYYLATGRATKVPDATDPPNPSGSTPGQIRRDPPQRSGRTGR